MKDYHINIFYSDEDGGYIADIPDLDACSAFGSTPEEALAEVEKAKEAWLGVARDEGKPAPPETAKAEEGSCFFVSTTGRIDPVRRRKRRRRKNQ